MQWWQVLLAVASGLLLLWAALVLLLVLLGRREGDRTTLAEAVRLLPDVLRLLRRLQRDPQVPRRVRWWLLLALGYLLLPLDLVPDVVPVVGYLDDALVVALVLRSVVRSSGAGAVRRHWPGPPAGLRVVLRLAGLPGPPVPGGPVGPA